MDGLEIASSDEIILENDFLIIGLDLSEEDAEILGVPIRIGFNDLKIIWCDDIDPK